MRVGDKTRTFRANEVSK